jgi:SPP1 gp7 family putative phage head morphogenesis protein
VQPDLENLEARIDKDRRERENDLLAFLLLLFARARDHVYAALRVGASPLDAARDVLLGNPALGIIGGAPGLARHLVAADVAGYRRTTLVVPEMANAPKPPPIIRPGHEPMIPPPPPPRKPNGYVPGTDYGSYARQSMAQTLGTLNRKLLPAVARAAGQGWRKQQDAARDVFTGEGYVESATSKSWLAETQAVTLTGVAWNGGWFAGFQRPEVREQLKGFRFSATLDSRTTDVCRACDGVKVPTGSPWLQTRTPPLHFNCRSVLLPIFRDFEPTADVPWTPWPASGFGHAPAITVGLRYSRTVRAA